MILIADSGATKTDWLLCNPEQPALPVQGPGFNPVYALADSRDWARSIIPESLVEAMDHVTQLYFYGAGFGERGTRALMAEGFSSLCAPDVVIEVDHDLMAAARATCQSSPGIVCILGTGSNSCAFDGHRIVDQTPNLGYLLGDEGGGTDLGRQLLRAYFYRELPEELQTDFLNWGAPERAHLLEALYARPAANAWLAGFAPFLHHHLHHPFVRELVMNSFRSFLSAHVAKYAYAATRPVHFVGSVAFHFQDILSDCLEETGLKKGLIISKPIDRLALYHCEKNPHQQD